VPAAYVASLWNVSPQSGGHELSVKHFTPRLERLNQNLHAILNGSDMGLIASHHDRTGSLAMRLLHEYVCRCLKWPARDCPLTLELR
jgi:hypothetical protein